MKSRKVTAISRAVEFSPNCEKNDAMIFDEVCNRLQKKGFQVRAVCETDIESVASSNATLYISMARGKKALAILERKEESGALVVNSAKSLALYNRIEITKKFAECGVPIPESEIVETGCKPCIDYPFWIKRGDECAQNANDVCFVGNAGQLESVWKDFTARGISHAVASKHACGDLVKFYGVADTHFFYTCFPTEDGGCGKFGAEKINGEPHHYKFSHEDLARECNRAANVLGIPIYGGDCIVSANGEFKIIDFNDWPSFSRCRSEAAEAISDFFIHTVKLLGTTPKK